MFAHRCLYYVEEDQILIAGNSDGSLRVFDGRYKTLPREDPDLVLTINCNLLPMPFNP